MGLLNIKIVITLQGTITCPTEREKEHHRLKSAFGGDILVPRRVPNSARFRPFSFLKGFDKKKEKAVVRPSIVVCSPVLGMHIS